MKILACSDIHNNLTSIHKLRGQENNDYDAILIAGDIGSETIEKALSIFSSFLCPVYFVCGNWDNTVDYGSLDGPIIKQVHHDFFDLGGFYLSGFSGCPTHWGRNPYALEMLSQARAPFKAMLENINVLKAESREKSKLLEVKYKNLREISASNAKDNRKESLKRKLEILNKKEDKEDRFIWREFDKIHSSREYKSYQKSEQLAYKKIDEYHRSNLISLLSLDLNRTRRTIVMTHERMYKLYECGQNPLIHIFGHRHEYKYTQHKGCHHFNVALLDYVVTVTPKENSETYFKVNNGGYSIISIYNNGEVETERRRLKLDDTKWDFYADYLINKYDLVPEDKVYSSIMI